MKVTIHIGHPPPRLSEMRMVRSSHGRPIDTRREDELRLDMSHNNESK